MSEANTRTMVLAAIKKVAPDTDDEDLTDDADIRDDLDLDSMDFLNLIVAVKKDLGVEIPEADYPQVATVGALCAYLSERGAK